MSMDRSLKGANALVRHRNVLNRAERLEKLADEEKWADGKSVFGLPKVAHRKVIVAKPAKEAAAATAEGAAAPGTPAAAGAPAAGAAGAAAPAKGAAPAAAPAAGKAAAPAAKGKK